LYGYKSGPVYGLKARLAAQHRILALGRLIQSWEKMERWRRKVSEIRGRKR